MCKIWVGLQRRKQRDIGEGEVCFHFLEANRSSEWMNLKDRAGLGKLDSDIGGKAAV